MIRAGVLYASQLYVSGSGSTTMSLHNAAKGVIAVRDDRPSSIDLSLELERQLETHASSPDPTRPTSLDPHILASTVIQLRQSLSAVSRERDDLSRRLSEAQAQQSYLKATMRQLESECTLAQDQLAVARRKMADDESAIAMLRAKVEESRFVQSFRFIQHIFVDHF